MAKLQQMTVAAYRQGCLRFMEDISPFLLPAAMAWEASERMSSWARWISYTEAYDDITGAPRHELWNILPPAFFKELRRNMKRKKMATQERLKRLADIEQQYNLLILFKPHFDMLSEYAEFINPREGLDLKTPLHHCMGKRDLIPLRKAFEKENAEALAKAEARVQRQMKNAPRAKKKAARKSARR